MTTTISPRATSRPATCPACGAPCEIDEPCSTCKQRSARSREGTVLAGRYELERVIGRGGFGVVYRAKHLALGGVVAVKFLLAEWARHPEWRARFEREAAALVRLHHPGIVTAIDFGEDDGDLYLVMEWVAGEDLGRHVGADLPKERIVSIVDQVLEVLEVAHAQGIVHRDLKPENIMLIGERVKVLDFGLVLISDAGNGKRLTASNAVSGTCYYMSPEQCRGRDVGPPADMYAIGCILFEILAGEPPFMGESAADVMMYQLVLDPPRIADRGVRRTPPPALEALVRACLSKEPAARPTATEMRAELRAFLEGNDAATRAERAARERVSAAGLSRSERAIGPASADASTLMREGPVSARPEVQPLALVWGFPGSEADRVRSVLSLRGVRAEAWTRPGIPLTPDMAAIVIHGDDKSAARTAALRAGPDTAKIPILVVGGNAERTPELIRAGASDVVIAGVSDDVLAQKLWRLLRRKR